MKKYSYVIIIFVLIFSSCSSSSVPNDSQIEKIFQNKLDEMSNYKKLQNFKLTNKVQPNDYTLKFNVTYDIVSKSGKFDIKDGHIDAPVTLIKSTSGWILQ